MTQPVRMKRRQPRKAEIRVIAERMFPTWDEITLKSLTRDGLRDAIKRFGKCECGCEAPFKGGRVDYDHVIPNAFLYDKDDIDWQVLLPACHLKKTKQDAPKIAKSRRLAGETGQRKRRIERGRSLIQGRSEIVSRGFSKPPAGYSAWGRGKRVSNTKVID